MHVVSSDGGSAMAASTVLPPTSGNSERMVSHTCLGNRVKMKKINVVLRRANLPCATGSVSGPI